MRSLRHNVGLDVACILVEFLHYKFLIQIISYRIKCLKKLQIFVKLESELSGICRKYHHIVLYIMLYMMCLTSEYSECTVVDVFADIAAMVVDVPGKIYVLTSE